jgi:Putative redox-active protein (C_GCAxxG_C_C).
MKNKIKDLVHTYYWNLDINCARTTLNSLSDIFGVPLNTQTLNAAIGLHGAGGYRAQCGLVEGSLMFIGIYYNRNGYSDSDISLLCYQFAEEFTQYFHSLKCYDLRPNGFNKDDVPHACEELTNNAIAFTYQFINKNKSR